MGNRSCQTQQVQIPLSLALRGCTPRTLCCVLAALLFLAPQTGSTQTASCGGKVINAGVTKAAVIAACGSPTQELYSANGLAPAVGKVELPSLVADDVDVLIYNFGPSRLMQRIWLQDGKVALVESLGYGH